MTTDIIDSPPSISVSETFIIPTLADRETGIKMLYPIINVDKNKMININLLFNFIFFIIVIYLFLKILIENIQGAI